MGTSTRKRKTTAEYKKMLPPQLFPSCTACRGRDGKSKVAYPNAPEAASASQEYKSAHRKSDPEWDRINVYPCPKGHGFHIGHGKHLDSAPARADQDAARRSTERDRSEPQRMAKDFRPPPEWLSQEPEHVARTAPTPVTPELKTGKRSRRR